MRFYAAACVLVTLSVLQTVAQSEKDTRTKRRMYAMCPPKFQRIGAECYAISDQRANWLEAHFQCKDKNSKLAEPNKNSDRKLRSFFLKADHDPDDIWIGATFDWHSNAWQWSISGKNLTYDAFSRMDPESRQNLEYHCAVINPSLKYRWSARSCVDKHRYICQHKMPKVSEKNRIKVYDRWNQTYPNQLANEVILDIYDTKSKDGGRIHRRVKPIDSSETYPIKRRDQGKPRRRPRLPDDTNNDITVRFIPNYLTNEINSAPNNYQVTPPSTMYPLLMDFVPGDLSTAPADVQAAQAYPDTTTTRTRKPTNAPSSDNETVEQAKPKTPKRFRTTFDKLAEQKRRQEREHKRAEHRRRKLQREKRLRAKQEEEKKRQQQAELDELKLKQAEEDKQVKEQELANQAQREKIEARRANEQKERERQDEEAKRLQEQRDEEEEHQRKQRLHEENRLRLEQEEQIKQMQTERERQLEEEKRVSEENRRRAEHEERLRQEELKRLEEEDEKRLELQRMQIERKKEEEELARLEEENRKRIAAQKAREAEIRRREEELERQQVEEKRLQEELELRKEQDRLLREQELQREVIEKKQKEEAERQEKEYQEQLRRQKEEKLKRKIEIEAKQLQEEEEERKKKEKMRKYAERVSRLSPEAQKIFIEARRRRKKNKNSDNEATIPERK